MSEAQDLREFITLSMSPLVAEITRLTSVVERQSSAIRDIEIKSTTRVAELQKDIEELREDVHEIKKEQLTLGDSQKFRWKTLSEERSAERKEQQAKDLEQTRINEGIRMITRLLWVILGVMISIGVGYVWDLITHGGIAP